MSESNKPIFPRQPENSDEIQEKAEKALENLVKEENYTTDQGRIIFCSACFQRISFEDTICPHCGMTGLDNKKKQKEPAVFDNEVSFVYGPPPMNLRDIEKIPVMPAYGPPPISILNYKFWLILIAVFIIIAVITILLLQLYA